MPFDRDQWRAALSEMMRELALDPPRALAQAGVATVPDFLLGQLLQPVVQAYADDPGTAAVVLLDSAGDRGPLLLTHLIQHQYHPPHGIAVAAREARQPTLVATYQQIAQYVGLTDLVAQLLPPVYQHPLFDASPAASVDPPTAAPPTTPTPTHDPARTTTITGDITARNVEGQGIAIGAQAQSHYFAGETVLGDKVVQQFFGEMPGEQGVVLLTDYLAMLAHEYQNLRLNRLAGRRQTGTEQLAAPPLRLQAVYTSLRTQEWITLHRRVHPADMLARLVKRLRFADADPSLVPPEQVRIPWLGEGQGDHGAFSESGMTTAAAVTKAILARRATAPEEPLAWGISRPELVMEALYTHRHLVLLGEPGAGKSTVLRYLALLLALRSQGEVVTLPGWPIDDQPIPIRCRLGLVASALPDHAGDATQALWQVIGDVLEGAQGVRAGLRDYLRPALRSGGVLLLFDGLDEVPIGDSDEDSPRQRVALAVRQLAAEAPDARIVVTCRVLPYQAPGTWQLPTDEGWVVRTIQPLTFGQVRQFVSRWYRETAAKDTSLTLSEATMRAQALIDELATNERVYPLVRSPLLLTMLAILHANTNDIPHDRVRLYEECVQLLLERWETVRTAEVQRPGLLERLGHIPHLEMNQLRSVLHDLALQAHAQPPDNDGRGVLDGALLEGRMLRFFRTLRSDDPAAKVDTFLAVLREDAGLLQARADDRYAFPHLTFQEYLAACGLADSANLVEHAYAFWTGSEALRWREVLLLLAGRLRLQGPRAVEREAIPWLKCLTAKRLGRQHKTVAQRRQDAALAAWSYSELGERTAFANSTLDIEADIEEPLRSALVFLLHDADPAIFPADRLHAAEILGTLGDPRCPVTEDAWGTAIAQRGTRLGSSERGELRYCCVVPAGRYTIGGWRADEAVAVRDLDTFWITRFPITMAQYAPFLDVGYGAAAEAWWSPPGWAWMTATGRQSPWVWNHTAYRQANRPVSGVSWYEAQAFGAWLTTQLRAILPTGYVLRLPTEAEWEAAALGNRTGQRQPYPWGSTAPTPEHVIARESGTSGPAPVGCCPAGRAASGAQDMVGNVWEWAAGSAEAYPFATSPACVPDEWDVPMRGGSWSNTANELSGHIRNISEPGDGRSFRLVLAPAEPENAEQ
jgi:formylglycine-generating enzyme required for sulfatase activity